MEKISIKLFCYYDNSIYIFSYINHNNIINIIYK